MEHGLDSYLAEDGGFWPKVNPTSKIYWGVKSGLLVKINYKFLISINYF